MHSAKQIWLNLWQAFMRNKINSKGHLLSFASLVFVSHRLKVESALDWLISHETKNCHSYVNNRLWGHRRISILAWKWRKLIYLAEFWKICLTFACLSETSAQKKLSWSSKPDFLWGTLFGFLSTFKFAPSHSECSEFIFFRRPIQLFILPIAILTCAIPLLRKSENLP